MRVIRMRARAAQLRRFADNVGPTRIRSERIRAVRRQTSLRLVQLQRLSCRRRRRQRSGADGRRLDLRQRAEQHLSIDRRRTAERHAGVRRANFPAADVADRRVRAVDVGLGIAAGGAEPRRCDPCEGAREQRRSADADQRLDGAQAMIEALHDVQTPGGVQAQAVYHLWLLLLAVCTIVFVAVMVALALALRRAPRATHDTRPAIDVIERREPAVLRAIQIGVAMSTLLLLGLLVASVYTSRALAGLPMSGALHIELTAHQWWWEARYDDPEPSRMFSTANELHVPIGRPVLLTLRASDVIHSFWVPSLVGKKDLIPGREATVAFRADRAGVYRGQCAEFCGYQHAKMALFVFADEPDAWQGWADRQRAPAAPPRTAEQARGRELFERGTCAMCHAVEGTGAGARQAPDLTHVASRATLAAGALPNDVAALSAWILDPQAIKPGAYM